MLRVYLYFLVVVLALTCFACGSDAPSQTVPPPSRPVTVPAFNRDSAYAYIEQQLSFGPRNPGSAGHDACRQWIVSKLQSFGIATEEQNFQADLYTGESFPATNIISRINPTATHRVLLAAHWDTRHIAEEDSDPARRDKPILGADDGGSGVGVLLEIARTVQQNPLEIGVDLVFFDAEDNGQNGGGADETWCLGSQYWARNLPAQNRPVYGILLDMVGSKGATFPKEGFSLHYARHIVDKVWSLANQMGYGHYFVNTQINGITDDHRFVNEIAGLPMIDIINHSQGRFGNYWHTHSDDISIIDKSTLRVVGQVVLAVLYREQPPSI